MQEDGLAGTLARGSVAALVINILGMGCGFGVQVLLARTAGPTEYGTYLYALGWMNIALLFGKLDLDGVAVRYVGQYAARSEWGLLRGFLQRSRQIVITTSVVLAVLGAAGVLLFRSRLSPQLVTCLLVTCALLPPTAVLQVSSSVLQSLKRVVESQAPANLVRPLLFGAFVLVVAFGFGHHVTGADAVAWNLAATLVALVMSARFLRRRAAETIGEGATEPPVYETRQWLRMAVALFMITVSQLVLSQQLDVVFVGSMVSRTQSAFYGAASQLSLLVGFGATAVLLMATPMFAELQANDRRAELQRLVTLVARANLATSMPVVLALVFGGTWLMRIYGPEFSAGYPILLVLTASQLVSAVVGATAGFLMSMTGYQDQAAYIIGGSAALNFVLTLVLTPIMGPIGTAIATLAGVLARSIVLGWFIWTRMHIMPLPFGRQRIRQPAPSAGE